MLTIEMIKALAIPMPRLIIWLNRAIDYPSILTRTYLFYMKVIQSLNSCLINHQRTDSTAGK